ncbi:MAG: HAD-IA family hydrolase [Elusimicrobia bacterium]|nr:HAD-IA family hydrolase [Candidatus Liberimonas magnetica]
MDVRIKLIIFDLDGTLVNTKKDIARAINYSLVNVGLKEKDIETITSYIGEGLRNTMFKALDLKHEELLDKAVGLFKSYYIEHPVDDAYVYPGVKEFLEKATMTKAVISNKDRDLCVKTLELLNINGYFDVVVGGEDPNCRKPDPCPLLKVMKNLGVDSSSSMIVGDMESDIIAGKAAKIKTCAVTYGFGKIEDIRKAAPDYLIDSFSELNKFIN